MGLDHYFKIDSLEFLKIEIKDSIFHIILNRPNARNAYNEKMIEELVSTLNLFNTPQCFDLNTYEALRTELDKIRALVITATGKSFNAGGDIKAMKNKEGMFFGDALELKKRYQHMIGKIAPSMEKVEVPTFALIDGAAIGAGMDLAMMCDFRIAGPKAKFAESFAKLGLISGDGGSYFLVRAVGYTKALELSLTGRMVEAEEALTLGLVTEITSSAKLLNRAKEIIDKMPQSPQALKFMKKSIKHAYHANLASHLELMSSYQGLLQSGVEHQKHFDS